MNGKVTLQIAFALALALGPVSIASAQAYPVRPVTIVVHTAPGGPPDTLARILSEPIRRSLGQPLLIENVSGAGGSIAVTRVARATADGYTLSLGNWNTHVATQAIYPVHYDLLRDFEPISRLSVSPLWFVGKVGLNAKSVAELIEWLKANPNKASVATIGPGSLAHVCGVYLESRIGTRLWFVPFRAGPPAYQSLVAGQTDLMCADASATLPLASGGRIRAYAVMAKARWAAAPDVPTMDEAGVPGVYMSLWNGLWAPRGTPKDVIARLNAAVVGALADPIVSQRLADIGQEIPPREQQTPEALRAYQKAEIEKWWPIIKAAGVKAD